MHVHLSNMVFIGEGETNGLKKKKKKSKQLIIYTIILISEKT